MATTYDAYDDATSKGSVYAERGSTVYLATTPETGAVAGTCDGCSGWVESEGGCIELSLDADSAGPLVVPEYSVSCVLGQEDVDRSS